MLSDLGILFGPLLIQFFNLLSHAVFVQLQLFELLALLFNFLEYGVVGDLGDLRLDKVDVAQCFQLLEYFQNQPELLLDKFLVLLLNLVEFLQQIVNHFLVLFVYVHHCEYGVDHEHVTDLEGVAELHVFQVVVNVHVVGYGLPEI